MFFVICFISAFFKNKFQVNQFQYEVAVAESFGDEAGFEDMP